MATCKACGKPKFSNPYDLLETECQVDNVMAGPEHVKEHFRLAYVRLYNAAEALHEYLHDTNREAYENFGPFGISAMVDLEDLL